MRRRIALPLIALFAITLFGAGGFVVLEGWSWLDALYMSVITVSTVGFGEVEELSGPGRLFTIFLIVGGVGAVLYLVTILAEGFLEGQFRRIFHRSAMQRAIEKLRGHVIVCGFGRLGRVVVEEIRRAGKEVVVVDEDASLENQLDELGIPFVIGSAASDEILLAAHIGTASSLVVATSSEADGVFITLAAKELNPSVRVHARGESEPGVRRLQRAGADQVTSPFLMGGTRVAAAILRPSVVDFLELSTETPDQSIELEEIRIADGSPLVGRSVSEVEAELKDLHIVATKTEERGVALLPAAGVTTINAGEHLIVVGQSDALRSLARSAAVEPES